ncbi:HRDC domain-containing protein [Hufsiella ginkgonis]|uniref:AAA family ATPase n=1 Tax=Hufsiella ginkgonis TaxID=2695274 RepID=A0A7K1XU72_9SPHI|nr:HRDC domain-containing protein [Hufsiella ginkgonis]MXV14563.1 AAA family ATPase [Hufsiella ginkgonis]
MEPTPLTPAMQLALDYVETTNSIIFLTGKAGTGKTTFLRHIRTHVKKRMAIAAPTGVAAINAGGMTVHSLFQMPFGPLVPARSLGDVFYGDEKKELLTNLELLVIDEVSMVRPDILDRIDLVLRSLNGNNHPFGGVQLLLIGDLAQLSPIIREDEWPILGRYYSTPYFFSSLVLQKLTYVRISLEQVFRQKEQAFVDLLNEIRNQSVSAQSLALLNARYRPGFYPPANDPYITLTTHNRIAQQLNNEYLEALPGRVFEFKAAIRGEFPQDAYPTETSLRLKEGAQVMFVKNDTSAEKLFYNGKIGTVTRISDDTVFVQCGSDLREITVTALEWTNIRYQLDDQQISETNAGSFTQLPLKLAWSITIHKSQGLTFDKAIIDVSEAFAHGQAYVALSRCRSLSGMVLRNPVSAENVIGDPVVAKYNAEAGAAPDAERLHRDQALYREFLLTELFNFHELTGKAAGFEGLIPGFRDEVSEVAEKFVRQIAQHPAGRVQKAAAWFRQKLEGVIPVLHAAMSDLISQSADPDKKAAKADQLIQWLMTRMELMSHFAEAPFTSSAYLELKKEKRASAAADQSRSYVKALNAKPNEALFERLLQWRKAIAEGEKVLPDMVLTERTMAAIAEKLPATMKTLGAMKGIGQAKAAAYGPALIPMIRNYQQEIQGTETEQGSLF